MQDVLEHAFLSTFLYLGNILLIFLLLGLVKSKTALIGDYKVLINTFLDSGRLGIKCQQIF